MIRSALALGLLALAASPLALPVARPAAAAAPSSAAPAAEIVAYGPHHLQQMDFYPAAPQDSGPRPLIVFVHGGAWVGGDKSDSTGAAKIRHYTEAGYHLASINYRLLPEVDIEDQARDVAAAIGALVANAGPMDIDPQRVVLMGHSAGAHLAALVGTDPDYLDANGRWPGDIAGVILLDGAALDVPRQIVDAGPLLGFAYRMAFGDNRGRQEMLSPLHNANGDNARRFFILHVERADSTRQARLFGQALIDNGTDARVMGVPGRGMEGHNLINAMLGRSDSPATQPVDDWLKATFAADS